MNWIALIIAGIFEIGWPLELKMAQQTQGSRLGWIVFALFSMAVSGGLLFYAQKSIPIGTAYAVWTSRHAGRGNCFFRRFCKYFQAVCGA